jgi:hypothetical protein
MAKDTTSKSPTKAASSKTPPQKMSGKSKLILLLFVIASILLLKQSAMLLLIGMLPAIVALIVDTTARKSWAKTVFCFNFSGILPYVVDIYLGGSNSLSSLEESMGDMTMWLVTYGSAGAAWIVIWFCPIIMETWLRYYHQFRVEQHLKRSAKLDEEWDIAKKLSQ